MKSLQSKRRLL